MKGSALPVVLTHATERQMGPEAVAPAEGDHEVSGGLPDPALNPLTNPVLGKNLGRWAHVYYTTPPERRDEAVLELLRDLEGAHQPGQELKPAGPIEITAAKAPTETRQELIECASCQFNNAASQHFCGLCGAGLKTDNDSQLEQQASEPLSPIVPAEVDGKVEERSMLAAVSTVDSGLIHERRHSWKYAGLLLFVLTAIGSYWLGRMDSKPAEPRIVKIIDGNAARPRPASPSPVARSPGRPVKASRPTAVSSENRVAPVVSVREPVRKLAKPFAGTPIGCKEDRLEHCAADELYKRTISLADTVDALFVDYNKRVRSLLADARAHESEPEQKKQERSRRGNYSAHLWEQSRLALYMKSKRDDALKYRMELLRRMAKVGLDKNALLNIYQNPQLCLDLHYVAEDLRRLAGKLATVAAK